MKNLFLFILALIIFISSNQEGGDKAGGISPFPNILIMVTVECSQQE
jgi:hypothetical protein